MSFSQSVVWPVLCIIIYIIILPFSRGKNSKAILYKCSNAHISALQFCNIYSVHSIRFMFYTERERVATFVPFDNYFIMIFSHQQSIYSDLKFDCFWFSLNTL